ncbi:MAG: hypothetical protein PHT60_08710 [Acidiphilium sp.]|nr:hypothetical protein [Acidiphilium sp.]MDD4935842.1 hypothetical protein [Acidiphilium sp.]
MFNTPNEAEISDDETEARIRRSLGLSATVAPHNNSGNHSNTTHGSGGSSLPRRRFVRDGEVPVVVLHPKSESENRHAAALADLTRQRDLERAARSRAEHALQEALGTIQTLQTRLAHADLARTERAAPVFVKPAIAEPAIAEPAVTEPAIAEPAAPSTALVADAPPPHRRRRAKPVATVATAEEAEPTPIKWWRDPPEPDDRSAGRKPNSRF